MRAHIPLMLACGLALAPTLAGQGIIDREGVDPALRADQIVRLSSHVTTTIRGRVALVQVEERFRNDGSLVAEGSYLYPMPGEAVFTDFSLFMGDEEVRGEMLNADRARNIYQDIVRRLKDPALLTYEGHGMIRARVFPIQPGETRKIILRYTQVLEREGDALRLRYTVGPREPVRDRGWGSAGGGFRDTFSYRVTADGADEFGTPYSPTHSIETSRNNGGLEITLDPDASGQVELFLPLRRGLVGTSVVTHANPGEDGYFMLLLAPPTDVDGATIPRDLSLVVDVSGSMAGEKLRQAQAALDQSLAGLRPGDRFQLIAFSAGVRRYRTGFTRATAEEIERARQWVARLEARGGTNIEGALEAVTASAPADGHLPLTVFLTDGMPSVGEQNPEALSRLASARRGDARIFSVGIGHDVNTYLLDYLAREGRGSAEYVAPGADVEHAVGALMRKIAFPALTDLRIAGSPVELVSFYPAELPDLFVGEELVVFGRYRGTGSGPVTITGERNGATQRFRVTSEFADSEFDNGFIPRLWASRRIGDLTRTIRLEGASEALIEEIRDLGLRHGILTEYTSYLVLEPGMNGEPMPAEELLERGRRDGVMAPAAAQTGGGAFRAAEASADMAQAKSLADADRRAERNTSELLGRESRVQSRALAGRIFVERDGVWTDIGHTAGAQLVTVAQYSDAYFELVRALPELKPYLATGNRIVIAGKGLSIEIAPDGQERLSPRRIAELAKRYRGL